MAKIGIGCTTYNRPECLEEWKKQIAKHTCIDNVLIYIAEDTDQDRQGVAKRKNECLRALKDCDYIFLFDDDCHPVQDGWIDFFINNAGENHVLFLNDCIHNYSHQIDSVRFYNDCGGVFMYIPKSALNEVGAFNEKFVMYGFEHVDWSRRYASGIPVFMMLEGTEKYLFSHDYSTPNFKSSISQGEKNHFVKKNWDKYFGSPIKNIYLPL